MHETLRSRKQFGEFGLAKELRFHSDRFQVYFRLSREQFHSLLSRVGPRISRIHTNYREPISSTIFLRWVIYIEIKCDKKNLLLLFYRLHCIFCGSLMVMSLSHSSPHISFLIGGGSKFCHFICTDF